MLLLNSMDFLTAVDLSAVYNAVGLAAYELFDNVDFDQWFKNQLLGELQVSHHRYCFESDAFSFDTFTHFVTYLCVFIFYFTLCGTQH